MMSLGIAPLPSRSSIDAGKRRTSRANSNINIFRRGTMVLSSLTEDHLAKKRDSLLQWMERRNTAEALKKEELPPERKKALYRKFRAWAKMAVILQRMRLYHGIDRTDYRNMYYTNLESINADDLSAVDKDHYLYFDITDYKANRQMRMSQEARRILTKEHDTRTDTETQYAMVALRSVKHIADYPVRMQMNLAKYGYFLRYESKRVLIRQGHRPTGFYFMLYGSASVIVTDPETGVPKTVCVLNRGDSFGGEGVAAGGTNKGELAMINKNERQSTVVSKSYVELLVISYEVYEEIFMSGGSKSFKDPDNFAFLRSIRFLSGWPIELIEHNPESFMFAYFKRNDVMVQDSNYSDWIYIVKSGSVKVLKKLIHVKPTIDKKKARYSIKSTDDTFTAFLGHDSDFPRCIQKRGVRLPPPFSLSPRDDDSEKEYDFEEYHPVESHNLKHTNNSPQRPIRPLTAFPSYREHSGTRGQIEQLRQIKSAVAKGKIYDLRRKLKSAKKVRISTVMDVINNIGNDEQLMEKRTYLDDLDSARTKDSSTVHDDTHPEFVKIQILTKGEVFGLSQTLFPNQPSMYVLSNGAECMMINKRFYLDNCTNEKKRKLKMQVSPYPSDGDLQDNLANRVNWDSYKEATITNTLKELNRPRSSLSRLKFK